MTLPGDWLPDFEIKKEKSVMKMTTLCYIEKEGKYLMLHRVKKHHDINAGKWIGVGGHVENGETPEECLLREVKEETGLRLTSYRLHGLVTFLSDVCEPELMCVFTADAFDGEMIECDEGELAWVDKSKVLALPTWEGDRVFLERLLSGDERFFSIKLRYEGDKLVEKKITDY
jgi:8-oxo-dGTP diphosphatase